MLNYRRRVDLLLLAAAIGICALLFVGRIPQDPNYHFFADTRTILGIRNFWNVVSNLPFLVAGFIGLQRYSRLAQQETSAGYLLLCGSIFLVALGSAYYHWAPSNGTLLWDRLPMTVAFMALFSMLLGERVIATRKTTLLWLLVLLGLGAALYWSWTESKGEGDLRPYVLVQFLPIALMPLILFLFPAKYLSNTLLWYAFGLYLAAKALEHFDGEILSATGFVSGHPLKHFVAAIAVFCIILAVPAKTLSIPKRPGSLD